MSYERLSIYVFFSIVYLISLILANCYYIDDVGRFANFDFYWTIDGRPLMQMMAKILGMGAPYLNIFPLGQLLAAVIFNYVLVLWGRKYLKQQSSLKVACFLTMSYLNLFLLENFSYVYESFGMMLSLSGAILLYAFPDTISCAKKVIFTVVLIVFSLSFYQASVGAYVSLAILELLYDLSQNEPQYKMLWRIGTRFLGIALGAGTYLIFVAHPLVKGYGIEHSSVISIFTYQGFQQFLNHLLIYYRNYQVYFYSIPILIKILLLIVIMGGSYILIKNILQKRLNILAKVCYTTLIVLLPVLLMVLAILPFSLLEKTVYAPRIYLSFTVFFMYLAILFYQFDKIFSFVKFLMIPVLLFIVSFSASYGNLLHREDLHDRYIAQSIAYDLNQLENKNHILYEKITIIGRQKEALELQKQEKKRPLMALLVPIYMNNDWLWGGQYLSHYRNMGIKLIPKTLSDENLITYHSPDIDNEFYKLYAINERAIIVFKENAKNK